MFKRSFMEAFKVRKNSNVSGYLGSVSTNFAYVAKFDKKVATLGFLAITTMMFYNSTNNF